MASGQGLSRQRPDRRPAHGGRGGGPLRVVGAGARGPRLRDRRRRGQGRRPWALARARRRRPRAALRDRVEVPADDGDDGAREHRLERGEDRPPRAVRDAQADAPLRRHGQHRDPPQRGGSRPQGRQGGRRGRDHQGRRRDPAGDCAADPAPQGQAPEEGEAARRSARSAARRRSSPRASGRSARIARVAPARSSSTSSTSSIAAPWTSTASARSRRSAFSRTV